MLLASKGSSDDDERKHFITELESARTAKEKLESENKKLTTKLDETKSKKDGEIKTLKSEKEKLETELNSTNSEKEKLEIELNSIKSEKEKFEDELNSIKTEKEKLETELNSIKSEKEKLEDELNSTNTEKEKLTKANVELAKKHDQAPKNDKEVDKLKEENSSLTAELETLKEENEKLSAIIEEQKEREAKKPAKKGSYSDDSDDTDSEDTDDTDESDSEDYEKRPKKSIKAKISLESQENSGKTEELEEEIRELVKEKSKLKQENELICELMINSRDMTINASNGVPISTIMLKDRIISYGIIDDLDNIEAFEPIERALKSVSNMLIIQPIQSNFDIHLYWTQTLFMLYQDISGGGQGANTIFDIYFDETTAVLNCIKKLFWENFYKRTMTLIYDEIERIGADRIVRGYKGSDEANLPQELRKATALAAGLNAGINKFLRNELKDRVSKNVFGFFDAVFVNLFFGSTGKIFCNCDVGIKIKVIISNFASKIVGPKKPDLFKLLRQVSNFLLLDKKHIGTDDDELIKLSAPDLNLNQIYNLLMNFTPAVDVSVKQLIEKRVNPNDPITISAKNY